MNRLTLNIKKLDVLHIIFCIIVSSILFVFCLLLLLLWNGSNFLFDFNWVISYNTLGYAYLGCWIVTFILLYLYIASESKSSRGNKLWEHEMDRNYIADSIGDDYFDVGDPYGD